MDSQCPHLTNANLTKDLQGKLIYKDECTRCFDSAVTNPLFYPLNIENPSRCGRVPQVLQWRVCQPGAQSLIPTLQFYSASTDNEHKDGHEGEGSIEEALIDHKARDRETRRC
jgi:hypothetical protein